MKELLKLANDDYQKRGDKYPKALVPDSIVVSVQDHGATVTFDFKNTSENEAQEWYEKSKERKSISKFKKDYEIEVSTFQDGDFKDDWQNLAVTLTKKEAVKVAQEKPKPKNPPSTIKPEKQSKSVA